MRSRLRLSTGLGPRCDEYSRAMGVMSELVKSLESPPRLRQ